MKTGGREEPPPLHTALLLASLLTHVGFFTLGVTALLVPTWVCIDHPNVSFCFSIWRCVDCQHPYEAFTLPCLEASVCRSGVLPCGRVAALATAATVYRLLSLFSLLSQVFVTERVYRLLTRRPAGSVRVLVTLVGLGACAQVIASAVWVGYGEVKFHCEGQNCNRAKEGSVAAVALMGVAVASIPVTVKAAASTGRSRGEFGPIGRGEVAGLSFQSWLGAKLLPLFLCSVVLDGLSLCLPWVHFRLGDYYEGGLLSLKRYFFYDDRQYQCISTPACNTDLPSLETIRDCTAYRRLAKAGTDFVCVEVLSALCSLLWAERAVYFAIKREFAGAKSNYFFPVSTVGLKLSGLLSWLFTSQASFDGHCGLSADGENIDFCADVGVVLKMCDVVVTCLVCGLYLALYYHRGNGTGAVAEVAHSAGSQKLKDIEELGTEGKEKGRVDTREIQESEPETAISPFSRPFTHDLTAFHAINVTQTSISGQETAAVCSYCEKL